MVATTQPLAAMAGLRTMMQGGNAVDAAVAAAAVLNVVEPMSTGMGGDLFALVWMDSEKRVRALNASGRSAGTATRDELARLGMSTIPDDSPHAVTVPGTVMGWQQLSDTYGRLGMERCLQPAIDYAEGGYPVSQVIASSWADAASRLTGNPAGTELLPNGRAPRAGEMVRLPELASSLRTVAEGGAEAFYLGPLAERISAFVQERGGHLTAGDFAAHAATPAANWVEPIYTDYRGMRCWQCPPNGQGVNALVALNIVSGFDLKAMGHQSPDAFHHMIESMRLALADGAAHVADPSHSAVPVTELLSSAHASRRRALIHPERAMETVGPARIPHGGDTVYVGAVDGEGNACSLINSLFQSFGTGMVVPGTGIALHNRGSGFSLRPGHPNALGPRKRPFHTIIPGMVTREGELWLTYGVMGAMQQAQGHLQVLANMIDFGLSPQEALDAPRFRVGPDDTTSIESLVPDATVDELRRRGHRLSVARPHQTFFGSGQIIERSPVTGTLTGGTEPRADGAVVAW